MNAMTCQTVFVHDMKVTGVAAVIMMVLYSTGAILNILLNSALLYSVWKLKLHSRPIYKFLIVMTSSDLLTGIVLLPLTMYFFWVPNCFVSMFILQPLYYFQVSIAILMILLIAVDRFLHMKYLNRYNSIMSNRKSYYLITSSVLNSLLVAGLSILVAINEVIFQFYFGATITVAIMLGFIALLYYKAFKAVKNRVKGANLATTNPRPEIRFLRAAVLLTLSLVLCFIPSMVTSTLRFYVKFYKRREPNSILDMAYTFTSNGLVWYSFLNAAIWISNDRKVWQFLTANIRREQQGKTPALPETANNNSQNNSNRNQASSKPNIISGSVEPQFQANSNNNESESHSQPNSNSRRNEQHLEIESNENKRNKTRSS